MDQVAGATRGFHRDGEHGMHNEPFNEQSDCSEGVFSVIALWINKILNMYVCT